MNVLTFVCPACGSLALYSDDYTPPRLFHPTNVVCASMTAIENRTLALAEYAEKASKLRLTAVTAESEKLNE